MLTSPPDVIRIEIPVSADPGSPETWPLDHRVTIERNTLVELRRMAPDRPRAIFDAPVLTERGWCCTRTLYFDPSKVISTPPDETSASAGAPGGGGSPAAAHPSSPEATS